MAGGQKRLVCLTCSSEFDEGLEVCPEDGSELRAVARDLLEGTVFAGKYEIISLIGSGGMGAVYKAVHVFLNKRCALKVLHSHQLSKPERIKRFLQEARTIAALDHPNIISVHEFAVTESGQPFLEMDYLEGISLQQLIDRDGPLTVDEFARIFRQVLDGLTYSHSRGVVHRDLKPSNIVLVGERARATAKVIDFGIAKLLSDKDAGEQKITKTGELLGSPMYMSPEQWTAKPMDARSDVYSLGCVMFECLTGHPPFQGDSFFETLTKHLTAEVPSFRDVAPSLSAPEALEEVVHKALSKEPSRRFQTAAEFKVALEDALLFSRGSPWFRKLRRGLARLLREDPRRSWRGRIWLMSVVLVYLLSLVVIAQLLFPGGIPYMNAVLSWKLHHQVGLYHLRRSETLSRPDQAGQRTTELERALAEFSQAERFAEKYPQLFFSPLMRYKSHVNLRDVYQAMGRDDLASAEDAKVEALNPKIPVRAPAGR